MADFRIMRSLADYEEMASAIAEAACIMAGVDPAQYGDKTLLFGILSGTSQAPRDPEPASQGLIPASPDIINAFQREEAKTPFACACTYRTNREAGLTSHLASNRPFCKDVTEPAEFACPICDAVVSEWTVLKQHLNLVHDWTEMAKAGAIPHSRDQPQSEWWYSPIFRPTQRSTNAERQGSLAN